MTDQAVALQLLAGPQRAAQGRHPFEAVAFFDHRILGDLGVQGADVDGVPVRHRRAAEVQYRARFPSRSAPNSCRFSGRGRRCFRG